MRRLPAILLLLVLPVTLSCRGLPLGLRNKPILTEEPVAHQQLEFVSDFPLPAENELLRALLDERDDVYNTLNLPASEEKITVHLFRNADTYHEHLTRKFPMVPNRRAFFVEIDTRLHVYAQWSTRMAEDLRHEVAHGYLHASVPSIPLWIDEGLAEYFEVPPYQAGFNPPHLSLLADLASVNGWKPNIRKLESLRSAGEMQQVDYAEAWAWAYFMLNTTPERRELLTQYLLDLRKNGKATPLSERLAALHVDPQRTLLEYISTLKAERQQQ